MTLFSSFMCLSSINQSSKGGHGTKLFLL